MESTEKLPWIKRRYLNGVISMGALPKKKRTRARIGNRQSSYVMKTVSVSTCPHCQNPVRPHHMCSSCGYYNGREVITKTETPTGSESN